MTENLPVVRTEPPAIARRDTDSWSDQLPAIVELARSICGTDFVPEALRDNVAATAAAILYGREIGLAPMTALSNVYVVKGIPTLSARIQRAQILAAGHSFQIIESTSARAEVRGRRKGDEGPWTYVTYTFDQAKRAGLVKPRGGWETNPEDMCFARASARLARMIFADVVFGIPTPEEIEGFDETPPDGSAPAKQTTKVQRKRTTKSGTPALAEPGVPDGGPGLVASPSREDPDPPSPPLPGEPGYETDDGVPAPGGILAEPTPEATSSAAPSSPDDQPSLVEIAPEGGTDLQRRALLRGLHGQFNRLGFTKEERKLRLDISAAISGEDIESSDDLTFEGVQRIYDTLAQLKTKADVVRLMKEIANAPDDEEAES